MHSRIFLQQVLFISEEMMKALMLLILKLATSPQNLIKPYSVNLLFSISMYFGVNAIN